jgi:hypothetical protein
MRAIACHKTPPWHMEIDLSQFLVPISCDFLRFLEGRLWTLDVLHGCIKGSCKASEVTQVVIEDLPKLVHVHGLIPMDENIP